MTKQEENRMQKEDAKKEKKTGKHGKSMDRGMMIAELFRMNATKRYTVKSIAAASGGADREGRQIAAQTVEALLKQGKIQEVGSGKYRLSPAAQEPMEGIVDMAANGAVYIKIEGQEHDIFVNPRNTAHALNGDRVKFIITRRKKGGAHEGEILSITERNKKNYVGVVEIQPEKNYAFVRVDSRKVPMDVFVHLEEGMKVSDGDKVLVHIVDWPNENKSPNGKIVDVLGQSGDNNTEMHAILAEFDLPYRFDPQVEQAAERIPGKITGQDYSERRDMRGVTTFTIDPADAKDFDDALSIRKLGEGLWEVGVHIADVTHYVTKGSVVDVEGESRATSVYLVDRTVPMLPERLSNDLCSLRPGEEKLTFSAVFELDAEANVLKEWFDRTVIFSDRRFSYEEAQQVIETGQGDFKEEVLELNRLAQIMRERRFHNGSITFEREEAKFKLDENGKPLGVYFKEQKESNQLIEEFMLLANRKVAEFVGKKHGKGPNARTFVYRVHDEPNIEKLSSFRKFITRFGYNFKADQGIAVAKEMNSLMGKIKGTYEENVISTLAIRTMAKAYYSTDNIGHYGLAFPYYTHFTSPIRRYPDMMVHRLLANYLAAGKSPEKRVYEELCEHSSEMEIRAAGAERASIKYKMVEFMADKIGEEFDGHISGVTEWGVYVELDESHIEGMVALRDMTDDFYSYDDESYSIQGQSASRIFTLGDAVRIKVLRADLARKQLDFMLTASYDFASGEAIPVAESRPEWMRDAGRRRTSRPADNYPGSGRKGGGKGRKGRR